MRENGGAEGSRGGKGEQGGRGEKSVGGGMACKAPQGGRHGTAWQDGDGGAGSRGFPEDVGWWAGTSDRGRDDGRVRWGRPQGRRLAKQGIRTNNEMNAMTFKGNPGRKTFAILLSTAVGMAALAFGNSGCVGWGGGGAGADVRAVPAGEAYGGTPGRLEELDEAGEWALYAGETEEDAAFVAAEAEKDPEMALPRNSLFLRRPAADGTPEWRVVLTSGTGWRAEGMVDWMEEEFRERLHVLHARFSADRRRILLVLDPHTHAWFAVCSYDWRAKVLRFLSDGGGIEELPDGTLLVKEVKTYRRDANGESLGAVWEDKVFAADGRAIPDPDPRGRASGVD